MTTFSGLYPATVVPFTESDTVDAEALRRVIEYSSTPRGVSGVVVSGHMGELMMLDAAERREVVRVARAAAPAGKHVIAGVEGRTPKALATAAREAVDAGADALLVCPPFDARPLRPLVGHAEAALTYFRAVADAVDVPLIVFQYNRASGIAYPLDVLERLVDLPAVRAVKAGTRDITDYVALHHRLAGKVDILAASDGPPLISMLMHGADGALIGVSSVGTPIWAELVELAAAGDLAGAHRLFQQRCLPLTEAIYENQQPTGHISPVGAAKEALVQLGLLSNNRIRPPAVGPDAERTGQIAEALKRAGLVGAGVPVGVGAS
ncbi:dihydrodipicolinate synthase family protein [Rhizomonospora bruguierae]|uniref:dihydrodipicolinate synthase family protein n=1 Tax=Rhizomonospora bruguierae TaxID=1581705 RepID=UPI001BCFBC0D|nr:dihydrodipicolinate synthase family protein [Micromonospora sp. NBRC 107566]